MHSQLRRRRWRKRRSWLSPSPQLHLADRLQCLLTRDLKSWSDRFNRLEALLLAKTLDQLQHQPTFNTVKVVPAHSPPANVIRSEPFIKPTDQSASQPTDRPSVSAVTDPPASKPQSDRPRAMDRPAASDRPSTSVSSAFQPTRRDRRFRQCCFRPPVDIFVEEGELLNELETTITDPDQSLSEEQSYRKTTRGIRSYMGWTRISDIDSTADTSNDNPFAGPKL